MNVDAIRKALSVDYRLLDMDYFADCGTVGCIAGHCLLQNGYTLEQIKGKDGQEIAQKAAVIIKLTEEQAMRLFYVRFWPKVFRSPNLNAMVIDERSVPLIARTKRYRARVKDRVNHFISTDGAE